ncbi:hypothetical protein HPB51_006774 [Rhipicephalus microplus]|uniref:Amino acid transporter n=1 Tax=Rhipicephalus microplus TaxID=6941 RepID=A0A9J6E7M7_RHIMP|nr:hypothetical protein HPB51_006774 [Rhipicephalus microplus]
MADATQYSEVPQNEQQTKPGSPTKGGDTDVVCLKPKMSLLNGITVIVGSIIGSGIFVSPRGVLANTGSVGASLIVWVVCGIFSMIGAYCYAELGCMITKTGADYAYIMEAFGPFVAFLRLWVECMIVRPCSQAIVALTFSFYVLRPIFPDCDPPDPAVRALAFVCIGDPRIKAFDDSDLDGFPFTPSILNTGSRCLGDGVDSEIWRDTAPSR